MRSQAEESKLKEVIIKHFKEHFKDITTQQYQKSCC